MITVIGAGAFGTALAICFATNGRDVTLVSRDPDLKTVRENRRRLPGHQFPASLRISTELVAAEVHLLVVPAQATRGWLVQNVPPDTGPLVLCAKGLELGTLKRQSQIAAEFLPNRELAVLTGPGFAQEIAAGKPTALALAGSQSLQMLLSGPTLRLYRSEDRIGAELGGALKNVVALACGIAHGAELGESAKASLLTRGLAEMQRLGVSQGAQAETFAGLSDVTVEGIATAHAAVALARSAGVDVPLADAVVAVLDGRLTVAEAISSLLSRPLIREV